MNKDTLKENANAVKKARDAASDALADGKISPNEVTGLIALVKAQKKPLLMLLTAAAIIISIALYYVGGTTAVKAVADKVTTEQTTPTK